MFNTFDYEVQANEKHIAQQLLFQDDFIYEVLSSFIERGLISLRNILKLYGKKLNIHMVDVDFHRDGLSIKAHQLPIIMQLKILNDYLGDHVSLDRVLDECIEKKISVKDYQVFLPFLIMVATYGEQQYFTSRKDSWHEVDWNDLNLAIRFVLRDSRERRDAKSVTRRFMRREALNIPLSTSTLPPPEASPTPPHSPAPQSHQS